MNTAIIQFWDHRKKIKNEKDKSEILFNGCTIHYNIEHYLKYIKEIFEKRKNHKRVPNEYDTISGEPMLCYVTDQLYKKLSENKTLILSSNEINNLLRFNEIIIKIF